MNRFAYVLFLIIVGELLTILAELGAIKMEELGFGFWLPVVLMTGLYCLSGCCLLPAYALSERVFHSTWTTAALTIGAVLILEPLIIMLFFSEAPSLSSLIGFIFGVLGLGNSLYNTAQTAKE